MNNDYEEDLGYESDDLNEYSYGNNEVTNDENSDFQNSNYYYNNIRNHQRKFDNPNLREKIEKNKVNNMFNRGAYYSENESRENNQENGNSNESTNDNTKQEKNGITNNLKNNFKDRFLNNNKHKEKDTSDEIKQEISKVIKNFIIKNPYILIGAFVAILLLLIPIFWGGFDNADDGSNSSSSNLGFIEGYESCKKIKVEGYGEYSLDEYVAGVIQHESYQDGGMEALKAQAVAARSYGIMETNGCTTSISNSQSSQTFSPNYTDLAKLAATETSGEVLTYNGELIVANYDSFCYADSDCPDSTKHSDGTYSVTYTKKPNNETHKIVLTDPVQYGRIVPGGGHAMGMSQLVSYEMAKKGATYKDILKYFYSSGVELSSIVKKSNDVPSDYSASGDYSTWKQCNAPWSNISMNSGGSVCSIGCAATSVAIQLARSGVKLNTSEFNPGIFIKTGLTNGTFTDGGAIYWQDAVNLFTNQFTYIGHPEIYGSQSDKARIISDKIKEGYYVIANVKYGGHYVAVDKVVGNEIYMFDPGSSYEKMFDYYSPDSLTAYVLYRKG